MGEILICGNCKKKFEYFGQLKDYTYKLANVNSTVYYCSYSCWREKGGDNKSDYGGYKKRSTKGTKRVW